jgi:hypothetical protein
MTSLSEDLRLLADLEDGEDDGIAAIAKTSELRQIDWKRLICFAIPIYNVIAPMSGMPPLPVPAFCTTPTIPDGA